MSDFEKFIETFPSKGKFYSSLTRRRTTNKNNVLNVWNKFEMKTINDSRDLYLRCNALLLADVFKKVKMTA